MRNPLRAPGFSIIELLIVIVIVSILASIAIPSYRSYVMRTNRTVAKTALQDLVTRQESYALDHKGYAADFGRLGFGSDGTSTVYVGTEGKISDTNTGSAALYQFSLKGNTDSSCTVTATSPTRLAFALVATPIGNNQDTKCGTLCVTSAGDRGVTPGTLADCWRR